MAPQNHQEPPLYRAVPLRQLGTYSRKNKTLLERTLTAKGLTEHSDDNGVAPLDVCAFQSSV